MTALLLNVSQTDLADGIASNACTVISVYTVLTFLRNEIKFDGGAINDSIDLVNVKNVDSFHRIVIKRRCHHFLY